MKPAVPPGHSPAAHLLLGFCAGCPDRLAGEEICGWRVWAVNNVPELVDLTVPPQPASDARES